MLWGNFDRLRVVQSLLLRNIPPQGRTHIVRKNLWINTGGRVASTIHIGRLLSYTSGAM